MHKYRTNERPEKLRESEDNHTDPADHIYSQHPPRKRAIHYIHCVHGIHEVYFVHQAHTRA